MNNKLIVSIVLLVFSSFYGNAQTIKKLSETGFYANFTPDGQKVVFSSSNFKGLKLMDLNSSEVEVLSDEVGAGYDPVVENQKVFFNTRNNKLQVQELNFNTKITKVYSNRSKKAVSVGGISLGKNISGLPVDAKSSADLSAIELIYSDGTSKLINVDKKTNKVWVSLSPDRTKILYSVVGQETFITDLKGNVIAGIDRAEAPAWGSNNKIVFMLTEDDSRGEYIVGSDIFIFDIKNKKSLKLTTKFKEVALYPAMSSDDNKVIFNNDKGDLFLINLKK